MAGDATNSHPSGTDIEAEAGRSASADAEVARSNLALLAELQQLEIKPIVDEENWHDHESPGFQQRVLAAQLAELSTFDGNLPAPPKVASGASVVAMSLSVQDTNRSGPTSSSQSRSDYTPSLISHSTLQSSSAARTSHASSVAVHHVLEEDVDGVLFQPPEIRIERGLRCSFWFLACVEEFDNLDDWDTHCQSHLHGRLPLKAACPFECTWSHTASDGEDAWQARMLHVIGAHRGHGVVDTLSRPDGTLLQHLWNVGIIDNAQLKELRQYGFLTGNTIFLRTAGLNEGRRSRRPHTAQRAQ
jgi:hypothetical protein